MATSNRFRLTVDVEAAAGVDLAKASGDLHLAVLDAINGTPGLTPLGADVSPVPATVPRPPAPATVPRDPNDGPDIAKIGF